MEKAQKYNKFINEFAAKHEDLYSQFILGLLAIRDQAHIFHWQTKLYSHHKNLDNFYDEYLKNIDHLVEMIMGIYGYTPNIEGGSIELKNLDEESLQWFYQKSYKVLKNDTIAVIPEEYEEIWDQVKLIISQIDKLKYQMSLI